MPWQKAAGVILDGVFFDDYGVAGCGDRCGVDHLGIDLHFQLTEVKPLAFCQSDVAAEGFVAKQLCLEGEFAVDVYGL